MKTLDLSGKVPVRSKNNKLGFLHEMEKEIYSN